MTETTLRSAVDKAQYVRFHDTRDVFVTWTGGHTFNVYSVAPNGDVHEIDVFTLFGEEGEAPTGAEAEEKAAEILENIE